MNNHRRLADLSPEERHRLTLAAQHMVERYRQENYRRMLVERYFEKLAEEKRRKAGLGKTIILTSGLLGTGFTIANAVKTGVPVSVATIPSNDILDGYAEAERQRRKRKRISRLSGQNISNLS